MKWRYTKNPDGTRNKYCITCGTHKIAKYIVNGQAKYVLWEGKKRIAEGDVKTLKGMVS